MTASAKGTVEGPGKHVAQNSALNRSVLNRARGVFCSKFDRKALRPVGHVHTVTPQNTSRTGPICDCF